MLTHRTATALLMLIPGVLSAHPARAASRASINGVMTGDCQGFYVNVGPGAPLVVTQDGTLGAIYSDVTVPAGRRVTMSGIAKSILVAHGATLILTGTTEQLFVDGIADVVGNAAEIRTYPGSRVVIEGIVHNVSGSGRIVRRAGSTIGGNATP